MPKKTGPFKFLKHETVGAEGAEQDQEFLFDCFTDTGDLETLIDTHAPNRIIVGRTGSGKTALLLALKEQKENVSVIEPDELSLQYLTNSTILRHLDELGVNLDLFYRLLWKHVFAVELIRLKYKLRTETDHKTFMMKIRNLFSGDKNKEKAFEYLHTWGERFWENTETRVHEITETFEKGIKAELGAKAAILSGNLSAMNAMSVEDRRELQHIAQDVVSHVQIHNLSQVIQTLQDNVFTDQTQRFYIVVDRLDENWVDDKLRYKLIRALIETVKDFQKIQNAKIILALRKDLLDRVIEKTRDGGFQTEKYQPLFLHLYWTKPQLMTLLDKRLNKLVQRRYSGAPITRADLFPKRIGQEGFANYLLERTMYRPRDIIQFANCCLDAAVNKPTVTATMAQQAEISYSKQRLQSVFDEWSTDYPALPYLTKILHKKPRSFPISTLTWAEIEDAVLNLLGDPNFDHDNILNQLAQGIYEQRPGITQGDFRSTITHILYHAGIIGLRLHGSAHTSWSFLDRDLVPQVAITNKSRIFISPMFFQSLGVNPKS